VVASSVCSRAVPLTLRSSRCAPACGLRARLTSNVRASGASRPHHANPNQRFSEVGVPCPRQPFSRSEGNRIENASRSHNERYSRGRCLHRRSSRRTARNDLGGGAFDTPAQLFQGEEFVRARFFAAQYAAPVPEPNSALLNSALLVGLGCIALIFVRRKSLRILASDAEPRASQGI
jgi:hypothetical protein